MLTMSVPPPVTDSVLPSGDRRASTEPAPLAMGTLSSRVREPLALTGDGGTGRDAAGPVAAESLPGVAGFDLGADLAEALSRVRRAGGGQQAAVAQHREAVD